MPDRAFVQVSAAVIPASDIPSNEVVKDIEFAGRGTRGIGPSGSPPAARHRQSARSRQINTPTSCGRALQVIRRRTLMT